MFPSNSNSNDPLIIPCSIDQYSHFPTHDDDIDIPLSFFHCPSPYYNPCEDDLLLHHHTSLMTDHINSVSEININIPDSTDNIDHHHQQKNKKMPTRKRSSKTKRDRHSKINTANGPRDRRMRLSLDVARHFFGLQDMLGFDKPSRTVEWLLIQAKPQIVKLLSPSQLLLSQFHSPVINHSCSVSTSALSRIDDHKVDAINAIEPEGRSISDKRKPASTKEKNIISRRKTTFRPLARDLREKARARAKARTKAKIMWSTSTSQRNIHDHETRNHDNLNHEFSSYSADHQHIRIHGDMVDESLEIMNSWSPNSSGNCLQNAGINQQVIKFP